MLGTRIVELGGGVLGDIGIAAMVKSLMFTFDSCYCREMLSSVCAMSGREDERCMEQVRSKGCLSAMELLVLMVTVRVRRAIDSKG